MSLKSEIKQICGDNILLKYKLDRLIQLSYMYRNNRKKDDYEGKVEIALSMLHIDPSANNARSFEIAKKAFLHNYPSCLVESMVWSRISRGILSSILLAIVKMKHVLNGCQIPLDLISANKTPVSFVPNYLFAINFIGSSQFSLDININRLSKYKSLAELEKVLVIQEQEGKDLGKIVTEYIVHEFGHILSFLNTDRDRVFHALSFAKPIKGIPKSEYSQSCMREFLAESFLFEVKGGDLGDLNQADYEEYRRYIPSLSNLSDAKTYLTRDGFNENISSRETIIQYPAML